jgi:hypothetical protein
VSDCDLANTLKPHSVSERDLANTWKPHSVSAAEVIDRLAQQPECFEAAPARLGRERHERVPEWRLSAGVVQRLGWLWVHNYFALGVAAVAPAISE